jgi:cytochrome c oxidase subunit 2
VAGTDRTILIAYGIATVVAVLGSLALVASTRNRRPLDTHRLAEFEKRWLGIVVAILVALLAATIWFTPYGKSTPADAQVVSVSAQQFLWRLNPSTIRVGVPVAFVTRSQDVNHGFGIYKGHKFIAQIQVVPDRSSTLVHTFHEPGTYTVLCLEYCGVGHHGMVASFRVTER